MNAITKGIAQTKNAARELCGSKKRWTLLSMEDA
jgi:hypothetical protein